MAAVSEAIRAELDSLATLYPQPREWTPPYIYEGWEADEVRKAMATHEAEREAKRKLIQEIIDAKTEAHNKGMHWPGYCPVCGPNTFYD